MFSSFDGTRGVLSWYRSFDNFGSRHHEFDDSEYSCSYKFNWVMDACDIIYHKQLWGLS